MIGTLLGILIPISYILIGAMISRYIYWSADEYVRDGQSMRHDDMMIGCVLTGVFWPLIFPFVFLIQLPPRAQRLADKAAARKRALEKAERDLAEVTSELRRMGK